MDTTNEPHFRPADVVATLLTPPGGVLTVPPAGNVFNVSGLNRGTTKTLKAVPRYEHPPGETQVNKQFTATICQTASPTGACLNPPGASVTYSAAAGATRFFRIFVKRPPVDPGFSVGERRVFIYFEQPKPPSPFPLIVGAESVAVKRG